MSWRLRIDSIVPCALGVLLWLGSTRVEGQADAGSTPTASQPSVAPFGAGAASNEVPDVPLAGRPDGSFRYDGSGFRATIRADGTVRMKNKWTLDLTALFMRMRGDDPYRSERRRFLEGTRGLREALADRALKRDLDAANVKLRRQLDAIWSAPTAALSERQRRTFELWDECADDEVGRLGKREVEGFVRARCPAASACAFAPDELARLNAQRQSRAPFQPYVTPEVDASR